MIWTRGLKRGFNWYNLFYNCKGETMLQIKNSKLVIIMIVTFVFIAFWLQAKAAEHPAPEPKEKIYEINAGVGLFDSAGSGTVQFGYWPKFKSNLLPNKVFTQFWTDDDDKQVVRQERNTPKGVRILELEGGNTSNQALGAAYCRHIISLRGCAGLAYLTNDNTANIGRHLQIYLEGGYELSNKLLDYVGIFHYSDAHRSDETFLGGGKRF